MKITELCLNLSIAVLGSIACSSMAIAGEGGSAGSMSAIMTGGIMSNITGICLLTWSESNVMCDINQILQF